LPVPGAHNASNAALAIAVGILLGRPVAESVRALADFEGPKQRCVITHPTADLTMIDDTYNASPSSIEAALSVLDGNSDERERERLVVLGDMLDLGAESDHWHASIAPRVAALTNTHVRLYGDHMPKIASLLGEGPLSIGIAKKDEDPTTLLDVPLHDQPRVVLIKGSRGMALERAITAIITGTASSASSDALPRVGVLANADLARVVRAYRTNLFVRNLTLEDLEAGEAQRQPYDIALVGEVLPFRHARTDVESDLAVMAQLLVSLRANGTAIFMGDREEDEEATELLAGVVQPSCRVMRITKEDKLSDVIFGLSASLLRIDRPR